MAFLIQLSFKFWYPEHHTGHLILVQLYARVTGLDVGGLAVSEM